MQMIRIPQETFQAIREVLDGDAPEAEKREAVLQLVKTADVPDCDLDAIDPQDITKLEGMLTEIQPDDGEKLAPASPRPYHFITAATALASDPMRANRIAAEVANQVEEAMITLRAAAKPLKFNRIAESFTRATFRGVEKRLAEMPGVKKTRFKGKIYYEIER